MLKKISCWFAIKVLAVGTAALALFAAPAAAVTIDAVYFAQTHVHQPNHPYFYLVGGKDTLIKAHVVDPATPAAPAVTALLTLGGQTTNLTLTGPAILPAAIPNGLGVVQHAFSNSFAATIPKAWVKSGLTVLVQAGAVQTNFTSLKIGAPSKVIMTMLDVHYFAQASGNYPSGWEAELEAKWPVADLELRRLRNVVFPELVIPPRGGAPAARIKSKTEYTDQTGLPFDGEQAAALEWNGALKAAAGTSGRISLYYMSIYGAWAGGQAGGFAGVGNGTDIGILNHELGHALSLPHWGDNGSYPYKGDMYGISAPAIYNDTHAGPVWAYDPIGRKFIPCTVQPSNVGGKPTGTYKCDPMQGGGEGFQEAGYLMNHFSDYSVNQMRSYLEGHVLIWNTNLAKYASWNSTTKDYTSTVSNDGVDYPLERNTNIISILATVSGASPAVCMVYPPIGPYLGSLIRRFDPSVAADRTAAASIFAPAGGCDVCVRVVQGGVTNTYMLAASWDTAADPLAASSLQTAAVNLRASDGAVTKIELLFTPNAQVNGLPANPQVLYTWPGYLGAKSYYWDNNGSTAGFGTAAGTWAVPTTGNATQGWSTNANGTILPGNVTDTTFDDLHFGNGTTGLAAGTITVSNTVAADSVNFASGSGAITLSGGTIVANSIVAQNTGNTISSAITLNGAGTVSFSRNTSATGILSLNGRLSGNADLTFTTPNVNSGNNQQTIVLGTTNTYTGDTEITTGNAGNTLWVRAGVANALPPTTVLTLNGGAGSGTGRTVAYDLNGFNQTLAGLTNIAGLSLRNQRVLNSSGTAATLTVSNSASFTFGGTIGNGGANLGLTKSGVGTLTLTNKNAYTGNTTINAGRFQGVVGGNCASSTLILNAPAAIFGVDITDNTKAWTNAALTASAAGTLEFDFGAVTPSASVSPLQITGLANFTAATPAVSVKVSAGLAVGTYSLMTWGSVSGTVPQTVTVSTLLPGTAAGLSVSGNTLNLVIAVPATYYWDNNGVTGGFGAAAGTWAAPTTGNAAQGWSTNATGATLPGNVSTTIFDDLNFGLTTNGLTAGTVTVSGTVQANSLTFASGSGPITLTNGAIALGGPAPSITLLNQNDTINSPILLLANATINAPDYGTGSTVSTLTLGGGISGSASLTFRSASIVANNSQQTILLNASSSYTGSTTLNPADNNANLIVKLGTDNALPPTTVLSVNGVAGGGSGRFTRLELNGHDQTLGGLTNAPASLRTQQIRNSSATAATLTVNNSANYTFSGRIESNLALTKSGSGTLTLSGTNNTYTGNTTVSHGTLVLAAASIATNSTVTVAGGAVLQLTFATTNRVGALVLNGVPRANGVYNSTTGAPFITGSGSLLVSAPGPSGPATLTNSYSGGVLSLSWPTGEGWKLQQQTNALNKGLWTNWVDVTDNSVNSTNITVDPTKPATFFRLVYP